MTWTALAEALERADGPSRELDGDILMRSGGATWEAAYRRAQEPSGCPHDLALDRAKTLFSPPLTASLDAIVALIGERLPGWRLRFERDGNESSAGLLSPPGGTGGWLTSAAATLALALCAAFCRAMAQS